MASWDSLPSDLKESNRQQAAHIEEKLRRIGCVVSDAEPRDELIQFRDAEVELMAEMEHKRWVDERRAQGWRLGQERSHSQKVSPYLVRWEELPDDVKQLDRDAVRSIPVLLRRAGLAIRRPLPSARSNRKPSNSHD
jgi:hypothetical protein